MRHARALRRRRLRGADVEAAVDLPRVGGDDLGVERLGELERERASSARGRADEADDARPASSPEERLDLRPRELDRDRAAVRAVRVDVDAVHRARSARTSPASRRWPTRTALWHATVARTVSTARAGRRAAPVLGELGGERPQRARRRRGRGAAAAPCAAGTCRRRTARPRARPPRARARARRAPRTCAGGSATASGTSSASRATPPRGVLGAQPLERDALVRRVLVDQHDASVALADEVAVEDLADEAQRREALRRRLPERSPAPADAGRRASAARIGTTARRARRGGGRRRVRRRSRDAGRRRDAGAGGRRPSAAARRARSAGTIS